MRVVCAVCAMCAVCVLRSLRSLRTITVRDDVLIKIGVQPQDLTKLNKVPLICAFVSLVINLALLLAMAAWRTSAFITVPGHRPRPSVRRRMTNDPGYDGTPCS